MWSDARHGANVPLARTAPQPGDARARATPPMRVDHLPNKRMPLVPGVIPGRGMACMDLSPHHITRESSWRSGGAHGRGMDEEHTPMAGATLARVPHCTLRGMCRVVAGGGREPDCGTGARRSRCGATGQRLDPPVSFVSLSARGVGASARCARRLWRCDERGRARPTDRPAREPPVREDRIGMPVRKHSIQLSYILFQPHSR
jgi:hypothetical protein